MRQHLDHKITGQPNRFWIRLIVGLLMAIGPVVVARAQTDGKLNWTWGTAGSSANPRIFSSPAVGADGTVYYSITFEIPGQAFGAVVALDPGAGKAPSQKWQFRIPENVDSSPVVGPDGTVYIAWGDGRLYALNKDTGNPLWSFDANKLSTNPSYFHSTPAISRDGTTMYVGVGEFGPSGAPNAGSICAISLPNQGKLLWRIPIAAQPVEGSPAIGADDTIYIGGWDSNLYALNPDGTKKWVRVLDGPIFGSPAIGGDGTIYIGTTASTFAALTPDNQIKWQRALTVAGSAVVGADGTVYVGSVGDALLYALNPNDGSVKWTATGQPLADSTPAVRADGIVLFGGNDNIMRAYDPKQNGAILWSVPTGGNLSSCPAISPVDHAIYFGSADGLLYSVQGNASGPSLYSSWSMFQHDAAHSGRALPRVHGGQLVNLATRGLIGGGHSLVAGFVLTNGIKQLLVRGVGPTLRHFGVSTAAVNPKLTILNPTLWRQNDDWSTSPDAALIASTANATGAFPLDAGSTDAALVYYFSPIVNYSAYIDSVDGSPGIALVEIYDADSPGAQGQLTNLSTRGFVGAGDEVLTPGFVFRGPGQLRVLVRAVGPGLIPLGVPGTLAKPSIAVYQQSTGQVIASNAGWTAGGLKGDVAGAASLAGAFPLQDSDADAAMILSLDPGGYTFQVSGADGGTGEALVEVYALPY